MTHYDYSDILDLLKSEPNKALYLHWSGEDCDAKKVSPQIIFDDVQDGEYTSEDFDSVGYCISEDDYKNEQLNY
jgi:hypothetical protein